MKKLLTLLGVIAFSLGAFATYTANQVGFETTELDVNNKGYVAGEGSITNREEVGNSKLWYSAGDDESKVAEYNPQEGEQVRKYDYNDSSADPMVSGGPGDQFLAVEASSNPLYRSLVGNGGSMPTGQTLGGDVVVDTLVQFTVSDSSSGISVDKTDGTKFALCVVGDDPSEVPEGATPATNLVVAAGHYEGDESSVANFTLSVDGVDFSDSSKWHRVTVRAVMDAALASDDSELAMGFVVYIDGNMAKCQESDYAEKLGTPSSLSDKALAYKAQKSLFLSIQCGGYTAHELAAVGFKGTGKVDDLSIVDATDLTAQTIAPDPTGLVFVWSEGVVSFVAKGQTYYAADYPGCALIPAAYNETVTISSILYDTANGYSGNTSKEYTLGADLYVGETLEPAQANVVCVETEDTYTTLAGAVAALTEDGQTIKILKVLENEEVPYDEVEGTFGISSPYSFILDLNGKSVTFTSESVLPALAMSSSIKIISSADGGALVATNEVAGVSYNEDGVYDGELIIGDAEGDAGVTVYGLLAANSEYGNISLVRGSFFTEEDISSYVDKDSDYAEPAEEGDCYSVYPIYTFSVANIDHTTASITTNGVTSTVDFGGESEKGVRVSLEESITVTYEPVGGYEITDVDNKTVTYTKDSDPLSSEGQVTVAEIPQNVARLLRYYSDYYGEGEGDWEIVGEYLAISGETGVLADYVDGSDVIVLLPAATNLTGDALKVFDRAGTFKIELDAVYTLQLQNFGPAEAFAMEGFPTAGVVNGKDVVVYVVTAAPENPYADWDYASDAGIAVWRATSGQLFHASTLADVDSNGTIGDTYQLNTEGHPWNAFARTVYGNPNPNYTAPGKVLVFDEAGYNASSDAQFAPLSLGGMWVKALQAANTPYTITDNKTDTTDRTVELGASNASTYFKFDESFTFNRNSATKVVGTATVEIADGKTFTINARAGKGAVVEAGNTLVLKGEGTLAVVGGLLVDGTLDLSAATRPTIDGDVTLNGTIVLPAGTEVSAESPFAVCDGTLSGLNVFVKIGDAEAVKKSFTAENGAITSFGDPVYIFYYNYPTDVPAGETYTFVGGETPETATTVDAVAVYGTLKTTGYITLNGLAILTGGTLDVLDSTATATATTYGGYGDKQILGNIIVRAGATFKPTQGDFLDWAGATDQTIDIYGTLALGTTRWSITHNANCKINLYPGAHVTGAGDGNGVFDLIHSDSKLNVYAGENGGEVVIDGVVKTRNANTPIWVAANTTLKIGGLRAGGVNKSGNGTLEISGTVDSPAASTVSEGTVAFVDTTVAVPLTVNAGKTVTAYASEGVTVPLNVTMDASANITVSGDGTVNGTVAFGGKPTGTLTGLTTSTWQGTVSIPALSAPENLSVLTNCGNADSVISLAGITGNAYIMASGYTTYNVGAVSIDGATGFNNGSSGSIVNFAKISGTGALTLSSWGGCSSARYNLNKVEGYSGTLTVNNGITREQGGTLTIGIGDIITANAAPGACVLPIVNTAVENPTGTVVYNLDNAKVNGAAANLEVKSDGIYIAPTPVAVPTAATGLIYDGNVQTGVAAGTGYTLIGNTGTDAGSYEATATLESGYVWEGGATEAQTINWSIAQKSVTATITLTVASASLDAEKTTVGAYTAVDAVSFGDDTLTVNVDYTISGLDAQVSAAGDYDVTVQPVVNGNYTFEAAKATLTITSSGGSDWKDQSETEGKTAGEAYGLTGDIAAADATTLTTWAKGAGNVDFANKDSINTDCYLLNIANDSTAEQIAAAKAEFSITSIDIVNGAPVIGLPTGYNGVIELEGATELTKPMQWHPKTTGDTFFRAILKVSSTQE